EIVEGRTPGNNRRKGGLLFARRTARRKAVDEAVLIPPIAGEKIAGNATVIGAGAVKIGQAVVRGDTGKRRRRKRGHKPLQHAEIGLADAADLAVAPGLSANPFNDVVKILLLAPAEKFKFAAGTATTAHVHVDIRVALLDVPLDRAGLAPEKLRARGKAFFIEPIGRCTEKGGIRTGPVGTIYSRANRRSVTHIDFDNFVDPRRHSFSLS